MAKGRKSTPKSLQKLRGNPRKGRLNAPADPVFETSIPPMPEFLDGKAVDEWMRITQELAEKQIITSVDMGIVAIYCHSMGELYRHIDALKTEPEVIVSTRGVPQINPRIKQIDKLKDQVAKYSAEIGMTPTSRNKVRMVGQGKAKPTKAQALAENLFKVPVKK